VDFVIPDVEYSPEWDVVVDTAGLHADSDPVAPGSTLSVLGRSLMVLREHEEPEPEIDHSVAASLAVTSVAGPDEVPGAAPRPELSR
jgi:isoamylase